MDAIEQSNRDQQHPLTNNEQRITNNDRRITNNDKRTTIQDERTSYVRPCRPRRNAGSALLGRVCRKF
ncbi:MAG TPA: hypothetical protein DCG24_00205 [Bacteroidetes bacterium]|nr:hypothetical protein [Bacteroidota bacterium]